MGVGWSPWTALMLRRAFQVLALAVLIGTVCFFIARSLPGDMAMRIAAGRYGYDLVSGAAADAVRTELGLNQPLLVALLQWLRDVVSFDLGVSLISGRSVLGEVVEQLGATLVLALTAVLMAAAIGLPLGVWSGLHPGGWVDRITLGLAVVLRATPSFLLAVTLMLVVAVKLGALPVAGDANAGGIILPALTLALGLGAGLARVTRSAVLDALASPAYEFARSKGLSDRQALLRHGARLAALPVVAYLGVHAVFLFEGAVIVESLFAWPGIGHELVHAVFGRDVPMLQGTALCMAIVFVLFNLLIDAVCLALDPRQRIGGRS
ncbi:MAG: ABC transporter permease [Betaproteobacteria bacterium]|nr:MAG: ABC transporter permease [Betaproteobacteria bacterium]